MATLGDVIGAMLCDVVQARAEADRFTAALSREYQKDPVLSLFPVPRAELSEITFTLRFAIAEVGADPKHAEVIVEAEKLKEMKPELISSVSIATGIKNYSWVRTDLSSSKTSLVETG